MLYPVGHFFYWLPAKIRGRFVRLFEPAGLDFSLELVVDFDKSRGHNLRITDPITFRKVMKYFMKHYRRGSEISFLDVGAGKGLLLFEAKTLNLHKIGGVELSDKCFAALEKNRSILQATDIECFHVDAMQLDEEIDDYNTFFLANPFPRPVMQGFLQCLVRSFERRKREIMVIYHYPTCEDVYPEAGFEKIGELVFHSPYEWKRPIPTLFFRYVGTTGCGL